MRPDRTISHPVLRIDEEIKVAAIGVITTHDRAKHSRIARVVRFDQAANDRAVHTE